MSIYIKSLKAMKVPQNSASPSVMLPGSTARSTVVKSIILTNTTGITETVNITLKVGGASQFQLSPRDMKIPPYGQVILDAELTLANDGAGTPNADQIYGGTTTTNAVDCVINGIERDL